MSLDPKELSLHSGLLAVVALPWLLPANFPRLVLSALILALAVGAIAWLVTSPRVQWLVPTVYHAPTSERQVALTFDDGPDSTLTPALLDLLRELDCHATFFVVGEAVEAFPDIVRRAVSEGHLVCCHTYRHSNWFHVLPARSMAREIEKCLAAIEVVTGARPRWLRPPQGIRTPTLRKALGELPSLICVTWSTRALDTVDSHVPRILRRLQRGVSPGAIVALHDGTAYGRWRDGNATLAVVRLLVPWLMQNRYHCVRLDELLDE